MKANCPKCGTTFTGSSLEALRRSVLRCCSAGKKKVKAVVEVGSMPALPAAFELPRCISSQNKTTYSHWSVHCADKTAWMALVGHHLRSHRGIRLDWSHWSIVRLYTGRKREMDFANVVGGAKPLIDCLTEHHIIVDDSPKHFLCEYEQRRSDRNATLLTLLDARV